MMPCHEWLLEHSNMSNFLGQGGSECHCPAMNNKCKITAVDNVRTTNAKVYIKQTSHLRNQGVKRKGNTGDRYYGTEFGWICK